MRRKRKNNIKGGVMRNCDYDPLSEFHLRNPDHASCQLLDKIIGLLHTVNDKNRECVADTIISLLGEAESTRLLRFFSDKTHFDFENIHIQTNQSIKRILPRLICHIVCLLGCYQSPNFISEKLGLDYDEALQILEHLKLTFTVDKPLIWLENFKSQVDKERHFYFKCKESQLHGREVIDAPVDTAEERRLKKRAQNTHHPHRTF